MEDLLLAIYPNWETSRNITLCTMPRPVPFFLNSIQVSGWTPLDTESRSILAVNNANLSIIR